MSRRSPHPFLAKRSMTLQQPFASCDTIVCPVDRSEFREIFRSIRRNNRGFLRFPRCPCGTPGILLAKDPDSGCHGWNRPEGRPELRHVVVSSPKGVDVSRPRRELTWPFPRREWGLHDEPERRFSRRSPGRRAQHPPGCFRRYNLASTGFPKEPTRSSVALPRKRGERVPRSPAWSRRSLAGPVTIHTTGRRRWLLAMLVGSSPPCGLPLPRPGACRNRVTH
jgi:hypothetical protein